METAIKDLFVRFITNRCTEAEKTQVLDYINQGGFEAEWEAALLATEEAAPTLSPDAFNEDLLYRRIAAQTGLTQRPASKLKWLGWAAALLLFSAATVILLKRSAQSLPTETHIATIPAAHSRKQWIKLADGTSVQLNKDSKLIYPDSFNGQKLREVTLIGEAYFDVKHKANQPFVIHTGKITTTVLGTAFNISAYRADAGVTVTVKRGRVKVQDGTQTLAFLTPNQQLAWHPQKLTNNKVTVDAGKALSWTAGDLIMDDITLEEASELIARRYQVKVRFKDDAVKPCRFSAAFLERNPLEQVLRVVGEITGASLVYKNGTVVIEGQGC